MTTLSSPTPSATKAWTAPPPATAGPVARLSWYADVARWAPSKHNTQPWAFVVHDGALEVWEDRERALPASDASGRELAMSCGAAVQLACVAVRALGRQPWVQVLPDGADGCLARIVEGGPRPVTEADRVLLDAVPVRRTDRGPLDGGALPAVLPFLLQSAAAVEGASLHLVTGAGERATLAAMVERADRLLVRRGAVDQELSTWLREDGDPRPDGVPASSTRGAAASYRAELVQRDFSSPTSRPAHDRPGTDNPVLAVLCTGGDSRVDWVLAGRALAAVLLRATVAGGAASYLNQPVEEHALRVALRDQLRLQGHPQLVLRIGAGGDVAAPPRRSTRQVLRIE